MSKREDKSLSSLIGNRKINPNEIDKVATTIHQKEKPQLVKEKTISVSVATPKSLYLECKSRAIEEDIPSLKDFYLHCVREYLKAKSK